MLGWNYREIIDVPSDIPWTEVMIEEIVEKRLKKIFNIKTNNLYEILFGDRVQTRILNSFPVVLI